ncbi:acyltransferase [Streptomyces sp. NPDC016309]|uniref:acyltransferase family protein n=1 Tax=Streptomyces sp. NPDC016309 TaxID=3364965 RepID=UPI0037027669
MPDLGIRLSWPAGRVEEGTPPDRDRAVDALRALAILGVVLGHWLVTALTTADGALRSTSPLRHMPHLAPISWILQTLAVFFLIGGHAGSTSYLSARARGERYARWLSRRLGRLFRPAAVLVCWWTVAVVGMLVLGAGVETARTLLKLALSPLWFLVVFALLTALTPVVAGLSPLWPLTVVALVDVGRFGLGAPAWLGWINVVSGWLVPWCLGAAWARGAFTRRAPLVALLAGAGAAAALLVGWCGYPAGMVGVDGEKTSNLDPPSLVVVAFGLAQCAVALLARDLLARLMRRPAAWTAVALTNLSAMTVFLWHQTAMMAVTATALLWGAPVPGLHTVPEGPGWVAARLLWLPVFAAALLVCWSAFRDHEHRPGPPRPSPLPRSRPTAATRAASRSIIMTPDRRSPDET